MVKNIVADRDEFSGIIILVIREGCLIKAMEMALGEEHNASPPLQSGDYSRLVPASYMLSHHGMQQHTSSALVGRPGVKQHSTYK